MKITDAVRVRPQFAGELNCRPLTSGSPVARATYGQRSEDESINYAKHGRARYRLTEDRSV